MHQRSLLEDQNGYGIEKVDRSGAERENLGHKSYLEDSDFLRSPA